MEVLIVNGNRHLINTSVQEGAQDQICKTIISGYPEGAIIDWDTNVKLEDVLS